MITRRGFLAVLPFLPAAAKAIVVAASAPAAITESAAVAELAAERDACLDALNVATHRFIRSHSKLVDGIFQGDPLLGAFRSEGMAVFPGGRSIEEPLIWRSTA